MKVFGRTSIAEFLGDNIVYRNLVPMDARLPSLDQVRRRIGLAAGRIPRKVEPEYAKIIVYLLRRARELEAPQSQIRRLVFVGDTKMNDGTAFSNICQAGGWPGMGFIASENAGPPATEHEKVGTDRTLYLTNRWARLADFDRFFRQQSFTIDESTAVIIDLDKTALGARGRNAHVIDQARVQSVMDTVASLLQESFDEGAFRQAYEQLNQVEFHPFTRDNQDYLAYVCLILGSNLYDLGSLVEDLREDRLRSFEAFIREVESRADTLSPALAEIHAEIYANVRAGDPTPFKAFRRNEYRATVARMGFLGDDVPVQDLLQDEILITQEVREIAGKWRGQGALLFGLSDKPDEASVPTAQLADLGYLPIHKTVTHAVGDGY